MPAPLRVDPAALHAAAAAESAVAASVAALGIGGAIADAADGVPGLMTGPACRFAAESMDAATDAVNGELATHSANLATAASAYRDADEELGRSLGGWRVTR